jgi:5'-nucleotidase
MLFRVPYGTFRWTMAAIGVAALSCNKPPAAVTTNASPSASAVPAAGPSRAEEGAVSIKIFGINDLHGQLTPKAVAGRPAGGAAALVAYLQAASSGVEGGAFIVHAGDMVGASPLNSSLMQDEPAIAILNTLANDACGRTDDRCNVVGTVGNHELDEGEAEFLRLIRGGNSPKGPFIENPWLGARFPYVSANLVERETGKPLLLPYVVRRASGVSVAFIGALLRSAPKMLPAAGIAALDFVDEATAINRSVEEVRARGVHCIVVTIHQGLTQAKYLGSTNPDATPPRGALLSILQKLDPDVDVVVSGHTHQFTNAFVKNAAGVDVLVTQAFSTGTAYADIDLVVDRRTQDVIAKSARIVTTYADTGPGLVHDVAVDRILRAADAAAAPIGNVIVGVATAGVIDMRNAEGESPLGDLVADSQRAAVHADFAFVNPGGIRDELRAGVVTYGALFSILPFGNPVRKITLTGQQIYDLLNRQWGGSHDGGSVILQVSGLSYTWDSAVPEGGVRVTDVRVAGGQPLSRTRKYSVAVNEYLLSGGDGFPVLDQTADRVAGPVDVDALAAYVKTLPRPFAPPAGGRVRRR